MPNEFESFYDNSNKSLYIKITSNNPEYNLHIVNELDNHEIQNVILDLKNVESDISIDFLFEKLKQYDNVITLVNNAISPELLTKIRSISSTTINYDILAFRDEAQRLDFEKDLTTNLLNLPLEQVERLTDFNQDNFNDAMTRNYVDLIIQDYFKYLDEASIARFKDTVVNIKGITDEELIRKLFSSLIDPPFSTNYSVQINTNIKEGLIDFVTIDFLKKYNIMLDYEASYARYVIFLRDKLSTLGSKENELELIFKGNIEQIIAGMSLAEEKFKEELEKIENHTTDYETLIHNIAALSPENIVSLENNLIKLSSRVDSKEEALQIINETIPQIMPEISLQTTELINSYLHSEEISLSA